MKRIIVPSIASIAVVRLISSSNLVGWTTGSFAGADIDADLLRARSERPRRRRAAEQRDELATFHRCNHSITSSARASSVGGISRPSALTVLRLITNSNLVGCKIGRSAGLAPLRMRAA